MYILRGFIWKIKQVECNQGVIPNSLLCVFSFLLNLLGLIESKGVFGRGENHFPGK